MKNGSSASRPLLFFLLLASLAAGAYALWLHEFQAEESQSRYRTALIDRGDIVKTVSANGSLNPVVLALVGTQISGVIVKLEADFNQRVEKGQVLARLDSQVIEAQLGQSLANLESAQAALKLAESNARRLGALVERQFASRQELEQALNSVAAARAQVAVAQAQIRRDRTNLGYTVITSPVSGVVVSRNIDVGQTVAASFQTPTLFTIAQDLRQMQIYTTVAEADVGGVRVGQKVNFTVDAFPERAFQGSVRQIRLDAKLQQNVVTYNVVIDVDNADGVLLPSMTAFVSIVVEERHAVLRLPLAALRYRHEGAEKAEAGGRGKTVYQLAGQKVLAKTAQTGLSDGKLIELSNDALREGDAVILEALTPPGQDTKGKQQGNFRLRAF
jgi:HlyD family secretion protein